VLPVAAFPMKIAKMPMSQSPAVNANDVRLAGVAVVNAIADPLAMTDDE
jgi:hypothetical protein